MEEICFLCSNCKIIKYNYQTYFYLDFSLNSILKYKKENNNTNNNINNISIYDCFDYYVRLDNSNNNYMFCNNCRNNCLFSYKLNLTTSPEILIIFLNRIEGIDLTIKFEYHEDINIIIIIRCKNLIELF